MKPIKDWVLVEPKEEKKTTESGIIVPTDKEDLKEGTVIAKGEGTWNGGQPIPMEVELNDKVLYKPYGVLEVEHNGKKHLLMKEDNIVAIL